VSRAVSSSNEGRPIGGRVLTYGVIPPQAGPGRVQWCLEYGTSALDLANRALGSLLRDLIVLVPGGLPTLPAAYPLEALHEERYAFRLGKQRVRQWFALRTRIEQRDDVMEVISGSRVADSQTWLDAEAIAHAAVRHSAEAVHCLREAERAATALPDDDFEPGLIDGLVAQTQEMVVRAHHCVHAAGEVIGGLFGCRAEYENGSWTSRCGTELMHIDLGFSAGFTARHACSICDLDLSECEHLPGTRYPVVMRRSADGTCNVCNEVECRHVEGETAEAVATVKLQDAVLHEVSMTPRPRDPRNRIETLGLDSSEMHERLGRQPQPDDAIWLHGCMYPCRGFSEAPAPVT